MTYSYDPDGNHQTRIDARGNLTTYLYDSRNLLTERQYPDGSRATFTYNALGDRTAMANQTGRYTTTYDTLQRKQTVVTPVGKVITYSYDDLSRKTQMNVASAGVFTYAYDANNQLKMVLNPQNDRTSFSYDNAGRRTLKELANGTRTTYLYDPAGNMTRIANLKSDNSVISQFDYTYDPVGNQIQITTANGSRTTYSYDKTYQLTQEHRTGPNAYQNTYNYDPTGNRILTVKDGARTTSTFDPANQNIYSEIADGRITYTFDQSGNRTGVEKPDGSRTTTTYDYENRDILVVLPSGLRNTMAYDPDGRRVQLDDSSGTTKFLWDGNAYLLETNGSNIFTAVYTQEPSSYSKLVSQYRFDGSLWLPSYYHYDNLGSTSTLTDDTENITDTYEYDAFGNEVIRTGDTFNPFRWLGTAGYYFNVVTGTFYVFMRTYDPRTGTWTTLDILQFINGMNMYMAVFVPNGVDFSGLANIPTIYIFHNLTNMSLNKSITAEVERIFSECLSKCSQNTKCDKSNPCKCPNKSVSIVWIETTRPNLNDLPLGPNPSGYGVLLQDSNKNSPGATGASNIDVNISPSIIQNSANTAGKDFNIGVAATIAHEIGLHAIGHVSGHYHTKGYVDAGTGPIQKLLGVKASGQIGADFSPEACSAICSSLHKKDTTPSPEEIEAIYQAPFLH